MDELEILSVNQTNARSLKDTEINLIEIHAHPFAYIELQ